jgi:hypothetical protein
MSKSVRLDISSKVANVPSFLGNITSVPDLAPSGAETFTLPPPLEPILIAPLLYSS